MYKLKLEVKEKDLVPSLRKLVSILEDDVAKDKRGMEYCTALRVHNRVEKIVKEFNREQEKKEDAEDRIYDKVDVEGLWVFPKCCVYLVSRLQKKVIGVYDIPENLKQGRGVLTRRVRDKAIELLDREITMEELRLMPYIQYTLMNNQVVDPHAVSREEKVALSSWAENADIRYTDNGKLRIRDSFWKAMNEILYLAYVDLDY